MTTDQKPRFFLYRFSQFVTASVLFLLVAGAMVTSTGSGLSVPDWPLSFGQVMPPMEGGVFYEHGHRMVATGVGILTVILAVGIWKLDTRGWMKRLGWIALALVIVQGVLGGITVLMKLPVWTSAAHACIAQGFFMLVVFITMALSPDWNAGSRRILPQGSRLPAIAAVTTAAVFLQLVLGAVMRHMNAGLVIPDFPLTFGGLVPPIFTPEIAVHYAHRVWAIVVAVFVAATLTLVLRNLGNSRDVTRPAGLLLGLIIVQVALGALVILSQRQVYVTSAHVVTGALLLGTSLVLTVRAWRFSGAPGIVASAGPVQPQPLGETLR